MRDKIANQQREVINIVEQYFKEVERNVVDENLKIARQKNFQRIDDLIGKYKGKLKYLEHLHDNLVSDEVQVDNLKYVFSKNKQKLEGKIVSQTEALIQHEYNMLPESSKVHIDIVPENLTDFFSSLSNFMEIRVDFVDSVLDVPQLGTSGFGADDSIALKKDSREEKEGSEIIERTPSKKNIARSPSQASVVGSQIGLDVKGQPFKDQKVNAGKPELDKSPRSQNKYYGQNEIVDDQKRIASHIALRR